jgi:hypothetical protein
MSQRCDKFPENCSNDSLDFFEDDFMDCQPSEVSPELLKQNIAIGITYSNTGYQYGLMASFYKL